MTHVDLQDAVKAILLLRSEMTQREARVAAALEAHMQALRSDAACLRKELDGLVGGAADRIVQEARKAVVPVVAECDRAASRTSARLDGASRAVLAWFGATAAVVALVLLSGWMLLGHVRGELAGMEAELKRYESALPIVQAFYASDAVICGERMCVNVDPDGQRQGGQQQYRQARPRPSR